eukprot:m.181516 g.181516  ORF g.181516 m.181516 type:complete len:198 (+) comp15285_c0_seq1:42-635(+)
MTQAKHVVVALLALGSMTPFVEADQCDGSTWKASTNVYSSLIMALTGNSYANASACCSACALRTDCTMWSHDAARTRCYLKKGDNPTIVPAYKTWTAGFKASPAAPQEQPEVGMYLIVAASATMLVYMVVGGAYNKYHGASGGDVMPNRDFWASLPGLVVAGAEFSFLLTMDSLQRLGGFRFRSDPYEVLDSEVETI